MTASRKASIHAGHPRAALWRSNFPRPAVLRKPRYPQQADGKAAGSAVPGSAVPSAPQQHRAWFTAKGGWNGHGLEQAATAERTLRQTHQTQQPRSVWCVKRKAASADTKNVGHTSCLCLKTGGAAQAAAAAGRTVCHWPGPSGYPRSGARHRPPVSGIPSPAFRSPGDAYAAPVQPQGAPHQPARPPKRHPCFSIKAKPSPRTRVTCPPPASSSTRATCPALPPVRAFSVCNALRSKPYGLSFCKKTRCSAQVGPDGAGLRASQWDCGGFWPAKTRAAWRPGPSPATVLGRWMGGAGGRRATLLPKRVPFFPPHHAHGSCSIRYSGSLNDPPASRTRFRL